ncbi:MAG: energy-coupling factor ABC transporter permease [Lachnospiraceae bacterium]|nr:energy-coupling factor ABC transporter permease [Lachnospiraceae bacterium]
MHMADALLSPAVAGVMIGASAVAAGISIVKLRKEEKTELEPTIKKLPTMAVMAALVFAGQMINYTIPGTGSSGHLCGGMMLTGLLGPYAGFLSMIVVLLIQCLFFADGGLMAIGANVWNMAFYGCFIGYFLIYRPIMRSGWFRGMGLRGANRLKIIISSILGCVITLQLGAFSVVLETSISGITNLPFGAFVALMQPIHLAIGLVEGLITAAVLIFVYEMRPELLKDVQTDGTVKGRASIKGTLISLAVVALLVGGGLSLLASSHPDGLEWSLFGNREEGYAENMGLDEDDYGIASDMADSAAAVQDKTSFLPDYAFAGDSENPAGTTVSGIVGCAIVAAVAALLCLVAGFFRKRKRINEQG